MLSANDYVNEHEISIRKKTYLKYCVSSFKKLVKSIFRSNSKKISALSFSMNYFLLTVMIGAISVLVLKSVGISVFASSEIYYNIRKYVFLIFLILTFLARVIGHISNKSEIDINKLIIKILSSIGIIFLNYSYTLFFLKNSDLFVGMEIIIKIILFFNTLLSIYIFDNFSKSMGLTKSQINSAFDDFFTSQRQIDDYLCLISEEKLRPSILDIAKTSAASDGLDVRENIALQRARILWGSHNVD